jgi:hypothetical protein
MRCAKRNHMRREERASTPVDVLVDKLRNTARQFYAGVHPETLSISKQKSGR